MVLIYILIITDLTAVINSFCYFRQVLNLFLILPVQNFFSVEDDQAEAGADGASLRQPGGEVALEGGFLGKDADVAVKTAAEDPPIVGEDGAGAGFLPGDDGEVVE